MGPGWQVDWLGEDQHEEESNGYDDKDNLSEDGQSISELHQDSPKVRWKTGSWEGAMWSHKKGEKVCWMKERSISMKRLNEQWVKMKIVSILSVLYSLEKHQGSGRDVISFRVHARTCTCFVHIISRLISFISWLGLGLIDWYFGIADWTCTCTQNT